MATSGAPSTGRLPSGPITVERAAKLSDGSDDEFLPLVGVGAEPSEKVVLLAVPTDETSGYLLAYLDREWETLQAVSVGNGSTGFQEAINDATMTIAEHYSSSRVSVLESNL
jgi:hypothetical protein